jgi:hypothetical protein
MKFYDRFNCKIKIYYNKLLYDKKTLIQSKHIDNLQIFKRDCYQ